MADDKFAEPQNSIIFQLELPTMTWKSIRTKGELTKTRDEHTAVLDPQTSNMIVFGGFMDGFRTNTLAIYNIQSNTW